MDHIPPLSEKDPLSLHKLVLESYGWPKWPPNKTPRNEKWWKQDLAILPGSKTIKIPNLIMIQLNGLATAGKSTLEEPLQEAITTKLAERKMEGVQLQILNDPVITTPFVVEDLGMPSDDRLNSESPPYLHEKDDWTTSVFLQISKLQYWGEHIRFPERFTDLEIPTIQLMNRGPLDAVLWSYSLLTHHGDPNFEVPKFFRSMVLKHLLPATADLQLYSNFTHANIMVGVDQKIAQKRRKLQKKTHPGWVTDSPIFEDYSSWMNYWIKKTYPKTHSLNGSGLLVVDGEQSLEANTKRISDYVVESAWRLFPGNY